MFTIDDDLKAFIESGVAAVAGTTDAHGRPHATYVWGPRVLDDRSVLTVFLESSRAAATLHDVETTAAIAVTFAHPTTYRSVQLKGRVTATADAASADHEWVQRHRDDFLTSTALVGDAPEMVSMHWAGDPHLKRVDIAIARAFDQTPGPDAGREL